MNNIKKNLANLEVEKQNRYQEKLDSIGIGGSDYLPLNYKPSNNEIAYKIAPLLNAVGYSVPSIRSEKILGISRNDTLEMILSNCKTNKAKWELYQAINIVLGYDVNPSDGGLWGISNIIAKQRINKTGVYGANGVFNIG